MICPKLVNLDRQRELENKVVFQRYRLLHRDGRQLIFGWFKRAWEKRDCSPENSFEPFIFTWIALNGWAACVTELDRDSDWRDALMLSQEVCRDFAELVADVESPVSAHAHKFHVLWPIFKAQVLRQSGLIWRGWGIWRDTGSRQEIIEYYLEAGATKFAPGCWVRHRDEGSEIPLDWPHMLAVLYRVRCNLFHGEKAAHSEMDQLIVYHAFCTLVHFLQGTGYLRA